MLKAPRKVRAYNQELGYINPKSSIFVLNPGSSNQGGVFPWLQTDSRSVGSFVNRFGARKKQNKNKVATGWCLLKNRVVRIYKIKGLKGRRFSNKKKVPKGKKCFKTKSAAQKSKGKTRRRIKKKDGTIKYVFVNKTSPTSRVSSRIREKQNVLKPLLANRGLPCYKYTTNDTCNSRKMRCEWANDKCQNKGSKFGQKINPANRFNYQMQQYSTNASTPSLKQLHGIAQTAAYDYPVNTSMKNQTWHIPRNNLSGYGF